MAQYTLSIMDILQENSDGRSLQDISVMTDVAKKTLFGDELNLINEKHRDNFAAGFAYHFFWDEIGMSPFSAWRMMIIEKIFNNADFINQTYDLIDKQIFANYQTTKTNTDSENTNIVDFAVAGNAIVG